MSALGRMVRLAALALGVGAAAAAAAQESPVAKYDTTQPIEITADALEVRQDEGLAVFTGAVNAIQGELVLRADTLRVHYGPGGESDAGFPGAVSRIDALGSVFFSTPLENAKGDSGVYDVKDGTITLVGGVVLTRGKNVLSGGRLELSLATGRSTLYSEGDDGRVRGLFVPETAAAQ
jgi:lipopolysaccharide export system protein LptA